MASTHERRGGWGTFFSEEASSCAAQLVGQQGEERSLAFSGERTGGRRGSATAGSRGTELQRDSGAGPPDRALTGTPPNAPTGKNSPIGNVRSLLNCLSCERHRPPATSTSSHCTEEPVGPASLTNSEPAAIGADAEFYRGLSARRH